MSDDEEARRRYVGSRGDLVALAKRAEALDVADRSLDAEVWWSTVDHSTTDPEFFDLAERIGVVELVGRFWGPSWRSWDLAPTHSLATFTASLDAVLALKRRALPEVGGFELIELDDGGAQAEVGDSLAHAKGPVFALLGAVLREVAATREEA